MIFYILYIVFMRVECVKSRKIEILFSFHCYRWVRSNVRLFISIPLLLYFYEFLHFPKFINSSYSLYLSIPFSFQIYQFHLFFIFINFFSSPNLSILPLPYFYLFLLHFLSIPLPFHFYQFPRFFINFPSSQFNIVPWPW